MDRFSKILLIPAIIGTLAGIGLDMTTNMLASYWPDAPHWLIAALFWSGPTLIFVPLPSWLLWLAWTNRNTLSGRSRMIIGLTLVICGCALGVVGLSIIAAGDGNSTKIARSSPPPKPSPPSSPSSNPPPPTPPVGHLRSEPDQTGTRIAVWQSINRQMDELSKLLNAGYSMLDGWPQNVRADRTKEIQNWTTLEGSFEALRAKLDRLRDSYDDREINDALQPVTLPPGKPSPPYTLFHSLNISVEAFLAQLRGIIDPVPESIEDDVRAQAGLILRDLNRLRKWQATTKQTSGIRVNDLSIADPPVATAKQPSKQLTMKDLLTDEFPGVLRHEGTRTYNFADEPSPFSISVIIYQDPRSGGEFFGFYIPGTAKTFAIAKDVFEHHVQIMNDIRGTGTVEIRGQGEPTGLSSKDTKFSGRAYVYYDNQMTLQELAELDTLAHSLGLNPTFRDHTYLLGRQQIKREMEANVK
jgi:hypothetical protein